jgi:hypothetical protein
MGDHRASIKIEMEFHGITSKTDLYINYAPNGCCEMDERVAEFFRNAYDKGMSEHDSGMAEYWKKRDEEKEKEELARLKAKYDAS